MGRFFGSELDVPRLALPGRILCLARGTASFVEHGRRGQRESRTWAQRLDNIVVVGDALRLAAIVPGRFALVALGPYLGGDIVEFAAHAHPRTFCAHILAAIS